MYYINFYFIVVAMYYTFDENEGWTALGTVTQQCPRYDLFNMFILCSAFFRTGWGTMGVESCPFVTIGISLEK